MQHTKSLTTSLTKRLLLPATVCLFMMAPVQQSHAAGICPTGGFMTDACLDQLTKMIAKGKALAECFKKLDDEYVGKFGAAGRGPGFNAQRWKCIELAEEAKAAIVDAYKPGGDTSPRRALNQAIKNWKKAAAMAKAKK